MTKAFDDLSNAAPADEFRSLAKDLYRLERLTRVLRPLGLLCFTFTITCLILSFYTALNLSRAFKEPYVSSGFASYYKSFFYASLLTGGLGLILVMFYEMLRKQGESLFEEISDELEWHVEGVRVTDRASDVVERPHLHARIILRSFARTTDLPLVPGKFGPALYAGVNLLAIFAEILFARGIL